MNGNDMKKETDDDIFETSMFKEWEKKYNVERKIKCPYCGTIQENDDGQYPVTYHGEPEISEMDCQECEEHFFVSETVRRAYTVSKTQEFD